ncbi:hybrid sensor histidine kinase/response regulator [Halopseudomonas salegens]|uniref:histidine kinase n=1 Tax=Halopseudomonas salegens TaxID=1434072 RepID=A0A1H2ENT0_9GAMM|nr:hybrid sensor histidine kinase/response regulator [Halopseudomonas salegens]SDT96669.1 Signal transduction histidine kinase [Halopseudomonas salegens]
MMRSVIDRAGRLFLLLVCLFALPVAVMASDGCADASVHIDGWLIDHDKDLTPERLLELPESRWRGSLDELPTFSADAFWFRLRLDLDEQVPCQYRLSMGESRIEDQRLYQLVNGRWLESVAGSRHPVSEWADAHHNPGFPIVLEPTHSGLAFVRIETRSRIHVDPALTDYQQVVQERHISSFRDGVIFGLVLLLAPFGLVMSLIYRSWLVLFNVLWMLNYFLLTLVVNGYLFYFPDLLPWSRTLVATLSPAAQVTLFAYVYQLFELNRFSRIVRYGFWIQAAVGLMTLVYWGLGDSLTARDWFEFYRIATYFIYPTLLFIAYRNKIRLPVLAWCFSLFITLPGFRLLFEVQEEAPLFYGQDHLALDSNLLLSALLIITLVATAWKNRRNELALQQRVEKLQQATRQRLEKAVELRTRQLKAALQSRGNFLARITHDLRSPLTQTLDYARQLMLKEQSAAATNIIRSTQQQLFLLDDLMDYARGDIEQRELVSESGYLFSFLREIEEEGRLLAERQSNAFRLTTSQSLPVLVKMDFRKVHRVLRNLLDNAAKFTRDGEILCAVDGQPMGNNTIALIFRVCDSGPGIRPELRQQLTQPFNQGNTQDKGYGLGLAIVSELLGQMGSQLDIADSETDGSCFSFVLEVTATDESHIEQVFIDKRVKALDGNGYVIMLVDDTEATRLNLAELLGGYGFDTLPVANGSQALEKLTHTRVDLIITDQLMPDMSGWHLLDQVRKLYPALPVVLYSGLPPQAHSETPDLTFDASLVKPAASDTLLNTVLRLCQSGRRPA